MLIPYFVPLLLISLQRVTAEISLDDFTSILTSDPEDGRLQFCELLNKYNYQCIEYEVITEDGYILHIFNVPGDKEKPIFLQHGFLDSSDSWGLRGYNSIAAWLANNTYDLWFGNTRGNKYSRGHITLNPDIDIIKYWDFSFHEMAVKDLPAMIDFILEKTGQTQLQVIAHSQGTTIFFVLGSIKPEYVCKIKIVICFAPVAYLDHSQQPLFPLISLAGGPLLSGAIGFVGHGEFLRNSSELVALFRLACTQRLVGYTACGVGVASVMFGSDPEQFEPEFSAIAFKHYPSGSSMKDAVHLLQIVASKKFQQYDYGAGNLVKYNSVQAPLYNLSKVPFNISLYVGINDRLSAIEDVDRLKAQLRNVVEYYVVPYDKWNHIDYLYGKYLSLYLFNPLLETLKKYF